MKTKEALRNQVEDELAWEPGLDESRIAVSVNENAVRLGGHVESYAQRHQAVRAAERVSGVRAVADELEVRLPSSAIRDDMDIAQSIARRLDGSAVLIDAGIKAEVSDGSVVLTGEVEHDPQRRVAGRLARDVVGVRDLTNLIEHKRCPTTQTISRNIAKAFGRQASLDAREIDITVRDSTAVLSGRVHSIAELRLARRSAYAAPGITTVDSHLIVEP